MDKVAGGLWAAVGKVVTALGVGAALVLSSISIYSHFTAAKSDLKASVEVNDFAMPPEVLAAATRDYNAKAQEVLAKAHEEPEAGDKSGVSPAPGAVKDPEGATRATAASSVFERFTALAPAEPAGLSQYVRIEVSNDGSLAAKGVSLTVPLGFQTVSVRKEDGTVVSYNGPKRIALGDINPREMVVVSAWSTLPRDLFDLGRMGRALELFYEGGMGTVEIVEDRSSNPLRRMAQFSAGLLGALAGLIALALHSLLKRGVTVRIAKGA